MQVIRDGVMAEHVSLRWGIVTRQVRPKFGETAQCLSSSNSLVTTDFDGVISFVSLICINMKQTE
jgi:hypothetical protein